MVVEDSSRDLVPVRVVFLAEVCTVSIRVFGKPWESNLSFCFRFRGMSIVLHSNERWLKRKFEDGSKERAGDPQFVRGLSEKK